MEKRYMFIVKVLTQEDSEKWLELLNEHPGWNGARIDENGNPIGYKYMPNMSFRCADVIAEWLHEKGLDWEWIDDTNNTQLYNNILTEIGWGSTIRNVGGEQTVKFTKKLLNLILKK